MPASLLRLTLALWVVATVSAAQGAPADAPSGAGWWASVKAKEQRSPVHPELERWAAGESSAADGASRWIEFVSTGNPVALEEELRNLGVADLRRRDNRISGQIAKPAIARLESCRHLAAARPTFAFSSRGLGSRRDRRAWQRVSHIERGRFSPRPRPPVGLVTSQGVEALGVDRLPRRLQGQGISVGILADSFDCVGGGRDTDVASGDLPAATVVLADLDAGCIDEGRALAQIVHDVAPGARLGFHTAFRGQADFAAGIVALADTFGADVIVDDVVYADEPFFQDGVIARAVDTVNDWGVFYASAVGNSGRRSYEAPFRDSGQDGFFEVIGPTVRHDFDPGPDIDPLLQVTVAPNASAIVILQWNEAFASASTANPAIGAEGDYDLLIYDSEDPVPFDRGRPFGPDNVVARSTAFNVGGDAVEATEVRNVGSEPRVLYLGIERFLGEGFDGPAADLVKIIIQGGMTIDEHDTASGTSYGHANARGAVAVGAAAFFETPAFGVTPPRLEEFSSAGGTPILRDDEGNRLPAPGLRETPDLVGPDGVNTTLLFVDSEEDDDLFPNFFGSSAAAPHIAGVAALLQGAVRGGASFADANGDLIGAWVCEAHPRRRESRRGSRWKRAADLPEALAAGARLGPCWRFSPRRIEERLERSAIDMGLPGYDFDSGHGLVDAAATFRGPRRHFLPYRPR